MIAKLIKVTVLFVLVSGVASCTRTSARTNFGGQAKTNVQAQSKKQPGKTNQIVQRATFNSWEVVAVEEPVKPTDFSSLPWGASDVPGSHQPWLMVKSLRIRHGKKEIFVPRSVFIDLAEIDWISIQPYDEGAEVVIDGADGGDAWECTIDIRNSKVRERLVHSGEFPDSLNETTNYVSNPPIDQANSNMQASATDQVIKRAQSNSWQVVAVQERVTPTDFSSPPWGALALPESLQPWLLVKSLRIRHGKKEISVSRSVFADLSDVNNITIKADKSRAKVTIHGADGGEAWVCKLSVSGSMVPERKVYSGEFPDTNNQTTKYVSKLPENM